MKSNGRCWTLPAAALLRLPVERHVAALDHPPDAIEAAVRAQLDTGDLLDGPSPVMVDLAELLVESLNLEDVQPADIDPEAPLFNAGLGLDSIDALELALAISKRYGFQLRSDNDENRQIFASLRALSAHVEQHHPAVDVVVYDGGQERYPLLMSVE